MEDALNYGIQCISDRVVSANDAVMFDIDDTLIYADFFGTPIPAMITLFHACKSRGYKMVIITARPEYPSNVLFTKEELSMNGIYYDELYFTPPENKNAIKRLTGYKYVLSVGDKMTDIGESEYFIKLPSIIHK